jgi:spore coat polysaccharide biosynthesis protein SpsF
VNGDSPFVDAELLRAGKYILSKDINFVTNLIDRTFPYGIALEWIDSARYKELADHAERDEVEHVTKHLYRLKSSLKFKSILCELGNFSEKNLTIDSETDLKRINLMLEKIPKDAINVTYQDFIENFFIETSKNDNNL